MTIQRINPDTVFSVPVFSQLVTVENTKLLFLAGQVAWDAEANVVGEGDVRAQLVQVFENIQAILTSVGASTQDIVKLTTYIVNFQPDHRLVYGEVLQQYVPLGDQAPASTLLGVQALAMPNLLVEIDVVAAVPQGV